MGHELTPLFDTKVLENKQITKFVNIIFIHNLGH
jgi:hypothetical protein